jgi:hypothetical protein
MDVMQALDRPLPPEIAGSDHGWLTRYRRWPAFSPRWASERLRAWGLLLAGFFAFTIIGILLGGDDDGSGFPHGPLLSLGVQLLLPLALGPWLGSRIRRRGWARGAEGLALAAVLLAMVLSVWGFQRWAAEPVKQTLAEWLGDVDASGQRRRTALMIGITVQPIDRSASAPAMPPPPDPRAPGPFALGLSAVLTLWMGGAGGLWAWRREARQLANLAQRRELERAQAQRREAELRLSVLAAQVEPHFLFNTLAGVRSAITTDPVRATDMVDHLADYLRASIPQLRSDGSAQATLGTQFDSVRAYLGLMAARMPRLQFSVQADAALLAARCPPLMLISLAENAVKHGVEPKIGPARITVGAERVASADGPSLVISVADDGVGFGNSTAGSGIGLANIRERLAQLYGPRASLTLKARPEGGVLALLTLPLEYADAPAAATAPTP